MAHIQSSRTHSVPTPGSRALPVSSCEQCGEADGLKQVRTKTGLVWHCFDCRRRHAVQTERDAATQTFLTRSNPASSLTDTEAPHA